MSTSPGVRSERSHACSVASDSRAGPRRSAVVDDGPGATVEQTTVFLAAHAARNRRWTAEEKHVAWPAGLGVSPYSAQGEAVDGIDGPVAQRLVCELGDHCARVGRAPPDPVDTSFRGREPGGPPWPWGQVELSTTGRFGRGWARTRSRTMRWSRIHAGATSTPGDANMTGSPLPAAAGESGVTCWVTASARAARTATSMSSSTNPTRSARGRPYASSSSRTCRSARPGEGSPMRSATSSSGWAFNQPAWASSHTTSTGRANSQSMRA